MSEDLRIELCRIADALEVLARESQRRQSDEERRRRRVKAEYRDLDAQSRAKMTAAQGMTAAQETMSNRLHSQADQLRERAWALLDANPWLDDELDEEVP